MTAKDGSTIYTAQIFGQSRGTFVLRADGTLFGGTAGYKATKEGIEVVWDQLTKVK